MNPIEEMRQRLSERFAGPVKPLKGLTIRPTANNAPRLPQSNIPNPRAKQERVGRPMKEEDIYKPPKIERTKPRDVWGGWL